MSANGNEGNGKEAAGDEAAPPAPFQLQQDSGQVDQQEEQPRPSDSNQAEPDPARGSRADVIDLERGGSGNQQRNDLPPITGQGYPELNAVRNALKLYFVGARGVADVTCTPKSHLLLRPSFVWNSLLFLRLVWRVG